LLVLTRFRDESIIIGDDVVVQVVDLRGDRVRLGVVAPVDVRVDRSEVRDRIAAAGGQDARASPSRHVDTIARLRCALQMVLSRGPRHAYTDREWATIAAALAPPPPP
jgi:carbon storage regulator